MTQALVLKDSTITRMNVIANRTNSVELGIIKSMMLQELKAKLASGIAHFIYTKKPNKLGEIEVREAWGTTKSDLAAAKTNGRGVSRELFKTTAYVDCIKGEWRSFRCENLVHVF